MKIGELARLTSVSADTLRYYEKLGLIRSERSDNGYRDFDANVVRVVRLLRRGKSLGFSLQEMRNIVETLSSQELNVDETARLLRDKVDELDLRVATILEMKDALSEALHNVCPLRR